LFSSRLLVVNVLVNFACVDNVERIEGKLGFNATKKKKSKTFE
jgi:hypothetical protein